MPTTHVIVTGSRPPKGQDGKYLPFSPENVDFIFDVLNKGLATGNSIHLYHGAAAGVDTAADDWFHVNVMPDQALRHRVHQFPAIWNVWDQSSRRFVTNKFAGPQRNHAMIEAARTAAYNKPDHTVVMLAFYATTPSTGTDDAVDKATRKNITVRKFQLPVQNDSLVTTPFDMTREDAMNLSGLNP